METLILGKNIGMKLKNVFYYVQIVTQNSMKKYNWVDSLSARQ